MGLFEYAAIAICPLPYIYHRWLENKPYTPPPGEHRIEIPKVDEGSPVPLLFGRALIHRPVVSWHGNSRKIDDSVHAGLFYYCIDVHWVCAIGFKGGTQQFWSTYVADKKMGVLFPPYTDGASFPIDNSVIVTNELHPDYMGMELQFHDGNTAQDLSVSSVLRVAMVAAGFDPNNIPGYRGYLTVTAGPNTSSIFRRESSLPDVAFELASYPPFPSLFNTTGSYFLLTQRIGDDANPADVIAAIICDSFGKLGRDPSLLDWTSFQLAAQTLYAEGHGYSRAFEDRQTAGEMLDEILRQIDGVLYQEPTTGLFVLKLIRADYDPTSLQTINPTNCESIDSFEAGGWANTVNKIRIKFTNRADGYRDGSGVAHNMANAAGQDGEVREQIIDMPGVTTQALADTVAARELAARSRPIRRCRAKVSRIFWNRRNGDVVNLNWPELNISNAVMRIANVSRGNASENCVYFDLIEDFFYVHRRVVHPRSGSVGGLTGVVLG